MIRGHILLIILLFSIAAVGHSYAANKAGKIKTTCYDFNEWIVNCSEIGQEGKSHIPDSKASAPRFRDNRDGTVTDTISGLMWLKDGLCFGTRSWEGALEAIKGFNSNPATFSCTDYTASYNDWRLPSINELEDLVNPQETNTASWLNRNGFTNVQNLYWSSTLDTDRANYPWRLDMWSGFMYPYIKSDGYYVWPVRKIVTKEASAKSPKSP